MSEAPRAGDPSRREVEGLKRSEERFRLLTESMSDVVWTRTPEGEFEAEQPSWAAFTGQSYEAYRGWGWLDAVHPDERETVRETWMEAVRAGAGSLQMVKRIRRADGVFRTVRVRAITLYGSDGLVREWFGTDVDLTDEWRAARARDFLAESGRLLGSSLDYEETLGAIARLAVPELADWCAVDMMGDGGALRRLAVVHRDPEKVELAYRVARLYPPDPAAAYGTSRIVQTGRPELIPEIPSELIERAAQDPEHLRVLRELGLRSYIGVPMLSRGEVVGVITLISSTDSGRLYDDRDLQVAQALASRAAAAVENARLFREADEARREAVEAREQAEDQAQELENQAAEMEEVQAELELSNEELIRANEEIELRRVEAEAANRAKSEFLANMSHEIRTPINAIVGYADLMEMGLAGPVTEQQRLQFGRIRGSIRHLLGLINDVLDLSKIEAGQMTASQAPVALSPLVSAAIELIEPEASTKLLELTEVCDRGARAEVLGDEARIRQILVNLLSNAVKFTEPGGRVTVTCGAATAAEAPIGVSVTGAVGFVRVDDTGIGIAPEQLESIFDPFVQVEMGRTRTRGGTGLGLTISRRLARLMGGDLVVESTPAKGSCFTLWLPAVAEVEESGDPRVESGLVSAQVPRGIERVAEALQWSAEGVQRTMVRRLRAETVSPNAPDLPDADLEDHTLSYLNAVAQTLSTMAQSGPSPLVLSDGTEIRRLIAERHGGQRARLGWLEEEIRREYEILGEELEMAVGERLAADPRVDLAGALAVVRRILGHARDASLLGHRRARAEAGAVAAPDAPR
jgi:PAS domain S-box-containing protein